MAMQEQPWQLTVAKKRSLRDQALGPYITFETHELESREVRLCDIAQKTFIDEDNAAITDVGDIETLRDAIVAGTVTAEYVTTAYIKRAVAAHQLTNCLTEILFEDAIRQARHLDRILKQTGQPVGPLHGIPITLKDQFNVRGYDSSLGYVGRSFKPALEDAPLVSIIKALGGVIIAKTNVPQSVMWIETENPLWGLTVNPRNADLTPGGSTGGEGALQALHGSLAGIGTDIGGSIRVPQALNGLYGLKPSTSRLPYWGMAVPCEGQENVVFSAGPMTRTMKSLVYLTRTIVEARPWTLDPRCTAIPLREEIFKEMQLRPLVIGVLMDDGMVKPHPPIQRAMKQLSEALQQAGHEVLPWSSSGHADCNRLMARLYTPDGGEDIRRDVAVAGEPFIPSVEALVNRGKALSVYEYWQLSKQAEAERKKYHDKWNAARSPSGKAVDVLLTPVMPHTATRHRTCRWIGYTQIWNFLDYTALTLPVSTVSKDLDPVVFDHEPWNDFDAWIKTLYDLDLMAGHPINLQIVGRKLEEEKVLGAAVAIERAAQVKDKAAEGSGSKFRL